MEYWSSEAITKFIFKMMPKISDHWTTNLDPRYTLPFIEQLLIRTIKSMKYENGSSKEVKEMMKELKSMAEKIAQMDEKYYEV